AGSRGQGVFRSADGGTTWDHLDFPQPDVFSLAVSAADGAVYAGCEPSMLFRSRDEGESWEELEALRSIPSAPTWSFPPRPWTSHVRWIAPSPHDAALLLAGIELGGVMRSEDGGATWSDHRPGAQLDCHCLAWHPEAPGRAYEAAGGGAAWSTDGGATWRAVDAGRDRHYTWALSVDPDDPDRWWTSASTGPYAAHGRRRAEAVLYRWEAEGPWQPLTQPLDAMPYALAVRDGLLLAGFADGGLWASGDAGASWRELELRGDPLSAVLAFA
ncbi:MAG: WD40/YVTN/BNR-like repeat-containing protein, partial [Gaiellaceae bacterium]